MFLRALAYISGASALVVLYAALAIVVALDLALIGVLDGVAVVHTLTPVFDAFLRVVMMLAEALPSDQHIETTAVHVIYLR